MDEPTAQVQSEKWNFFALSSAIAGVVSVLTWVDGPNYIPCCGLNDPSLPLLAMTVVWVASELAAIALFILALRATNRLRRRTYPLAFIGGLLGFGQVLVVLIFVLFPQTQSGFSVPPPPGS